MIVVLTVSRDADNFINFCDGQEITNGAQITTGSCNGIPMGKIPALANMISAMITNPKPGDKLTSDTTFNISVQTAHLKAGNFVNPTTNYYTAPQDLDNNGDIIGHCHVTIQDIGSLDSGTPPDPSKFAFFKGIDDAGNGRGLLQAIVDGGLPTGVYRVCTMIAAQNHQPVAMPVAQRGAQDDCNKFEVVAKAGGGASTSKNQKDGDMTKNQDQEGFVQAGGKGASGAKGKANAGATGGKQQGQGQVTQNQGAKGTAQGAGQDNDTNGKKKATAAGGNLQGAQNQAGKAGPTAGAQVNGAKGNQPAGATAGAQPSAGALNQNGTSAAPAGAQGGGAAKGKAKGGKFGGKGQRTRDI